MVDRTRKTVTKSVGTIDVYYTKLSSVLAEVQSHIEQYGPDAQVQLVQQSYSDSYNVEVFTDFPETDAEMRLRIEHEERCETRQAERDAAEFERLKSKFGC